MITYFQTSPYNHLATAIGTAWLICWPSFGLSSQPTSNITSQRIGFVPCKRAGLCQGYYQEPIIHYQDETRINADSVDLIPRKQAHLKGHASIQRLQEQSTADEAWVSLHPQSGKIENIKLKGHVRLLEPGRVLRGSHGHLTSENTGEIFNALYRVALLPQSSKKIGKTQLWLGLVGWGKANRITRHSENKHTLFKSTWTTCPPHLSHWHLSSKELTLNQETGRGESLHTILWLGNRVPVFYFPYLNFPIDDRRQSGFLIPQFGYNSQVGHDITTPYYFNLAPNYDLTIAPRYMSQHGFMLSPEFRYLTPQSHGTLQTQVLATNRHTQRKHHKTRRSIDALHHTRLSPHWSLDLDYHHASDDNFMQDFATSQNIYANHYLKQALKLSFNYPHWTGFARLHALQPLSPDNFVTTQPYYRLLPHITATGHYPDLSFGWDLNWHNDYSLYRWPGEEDTTVWRSIHRLHTQPKLEQTWRHQWGLSQVSLASHITNYQAKRQQVKPFKQNLTDAIPIFQLDHKWRWENTRGSLKDRHRWFPHLQYVYIPHHNQNRRPILDSGYRLLDYPGLFQANRFTGLDRVGDTHHIALGMRYQYSSMANQPWFDAGLAQRLYIRKRKVMLYDNHPQESRFLGYTDPHHRLSPMAGYTSWQLTPEIKLSQHASWSWAQKKLISASINAQYRFNGKRIINAGFQLIQNGDSSVLTMLPNSKTWDFKQIYASAAWPLNEHWQPFASIHYNTFGKYIKNYLVGLEYNSCCWAVRLLGGKTFSGFSTQEKPQFNKMMYIQFYLKGIGGNQTQLADNLLQTYVPGFDNNLI